MNSICEVVRFVGSVDLGSNGTHAYFQRHSIAWMYPCCSRSQGGFLGFLGPGHQSQEDEVRGDLRLDVESVRLTLFFLTEPD